MNLLIISLIAAALFFAFDFLWFYLAGSFFKSEIGSIARLTTEGEWNVRIWPAIFAYLIMGIGLTTFVHLSSTSLVSALVLGALFGFVAYGIYDLTNLATLSDWTWRFAVVDMLWGTFLFATVSGIAYFISKVW